MEFVTALRGTFDDGKPSLFELLSEQQLNALLPPTLRYLLTVLTRRYPRYCLRILNSFDELYALLSLVVERHYLLTRGGSFTEHFYGLKREKALAAEIPRAAHTSPAIVSESLRLSSRKGDIWRNLLVMVGIPYLKRKLDESYEINAPRALLGSAYNRLPPNATFKEKIMHYYRWFLRHVYPSVHAAYYFALLAFNLAYLFDNTKYHNPFLWMIGTRVRRMNSADYAAIDALEKASSRALGGAGAAGAAAAGGGLSSMFSPRNISARMMGGLSLVLPTSIFALKFLEWWYASDFAKQLSRKAAESLDLPPPVVTGLPPIGDSRQKPRGRDEKEEDQEGEDEEDRLKETAPVAATSLLPIFTVPAPESSDLCPICEEEIVNPTACQTGIVYCYTCIHKWLVGSHPRQEAFMAGSYPSPSGVDDGDKSTRSRQGKWESGEGRCAVTGRRVLGGTEGLRRIMV